MLEKAMLSAARAAVILGCSELLLGMSQSILTGATFDFCNAADFVNEIMVAFFVWIGSRSFRNVYRTQVRRFTSVDATKSALEGLYSTTPFAQCTMHGHKHTWAAPSVAAWWATRGPPWPLIIVNNSLWLSQR